MLSSSDQKVALLREKLLGLISFRRMSKVCLFVIQLTKALQHRLIKAFLILYITVGLLHSSEENGAVLITDGNSFIEVT